MPRTIDVGDHIQIEVYHELPLVSPPNQTEEMLMFQDGLPRKAPGVSLAQVVIENIRTNDLTVPNAVPNWDETEW